jgi:YVTN family beta-propeller protein
MLKEIYLMRKPVNLVLVIVITLALFAGLLPTTTALAGKQPPPGGNGFADGKIVVANRGSGDISVIDARSGELITNIPLPQGDADIFPEPMYVVYTQVGDQVFVGDRANNRVVSFDANDFSILGSVPTGRGVFHMWADFRGRQLWVNNDIDKTTTVIDPETLSVITTVPTPSDLVEMGGKPHDVLLDAKGRYAFVSVLGLPGESDYVIQYSTKTFEEIGRAMVGKDPHLSFSVRSKQLYVPCQGSDALYVLDAKSLEQVTVLEIPGAHGAGMAFNGKIFYTANLPGGGFNALFAVDTKANMIVGEPTDSPYAVPHNIALTPIPDKLFLTHSGGASDKVTFYDVSASDPSPVFIGEVTVGLNPFGLSYVP